MWLPTCSHWAAVSDHPFNNEQSWLMNTLPLPWRRPFRLKHVGMFLLVWMLMLKEFTMLFFWNLLFFFWTFFGTYLPLQILSYWNHSTNKMFSFLRKCWLLLLAFLSFILLEILIFFWKKFSSSSLWGFFQISFCYNFSITIQQLKCAF